MLLHASQRCRRSSPALVPSQKCWVSGVGFGLARAASAMSENPPFEAPGDRPVVAVLMRHLTIPVNGPARLPHGRIPGHANTDRDACMPLNSQARVRAVAMRASHQARRESMKDTPTLAALAGDLANGRSSARKLVEECLA